MRKSSVVIPRSWCYGGIFVGFAFVLYLVGTMAFDSDDIRPQAKVDDDRTIASEATTTSANIDADGYSVRAKVLDTNSAAAKTQTRR